MLALGLVLGVAPGALADKPDGGMAMGGVKYTANAPAMRPVHATFNARAADVANGRARVTVEEIDYQFHAVITCFLKVGDNVAHFSGRIISGDAESLARGWFYASVVDNGEGANDPPDLVAFNREPFDRQCDTDLLDDNRMSPVEHGNLQVR